MDRRLTVAAIVAAGAWARTAVAEVDSTEHARCTGPLDEAGVVRCALAASPEVRAARAELDAASGRRATASIVLPSNPTLGGTLARRTTPAPGSVSVPNWSVTLSQELEIAGQRGARVDASEAEVSARTRGVVVAEQEVTAGALAAFYEALAAQESLRFAAELAEGAKALVTYAEARAREELIAGVEADVARAEAARINLMPVDAERKLAEARVALAVLLDIEPRTLQLPAGLPSTAIPEVIARALATSGDASQLEEQAMRLRGEVAAADMERQVLERRLALIRRGRVPNPTVSAFVAREEIDDRVVGVGLSIPIPLPEPVGRTRSGEIAEAIGHLRAAEASAELVRRRVRFEVSRAVAALRARQSAAGLIAPDLVTRAHAD
ncbi:MAG TPA: TolC family protein, partial [Polyangia bacterium]|nr:TolC family protein [Polyangia bacterium]